MMLERTKEGTGRYPISFHVIMQVLTRGFTTEMLLLWMNKQDT